MAPPGDGFQPAEVNVKGTGPVAPSVAVPAALSETSGLEKARDNGLTTWCDLAVNAEPIGHGVRKQKEKRC